MSGARPRSGSPDGRKSSEKDFCNLEGQYRFVKTSVIPKRLTWHPVAKIDRKDFGVRFRSAWSHSAMHARQ
jgi:hypothetical protein